ncbi:MAG: hypothetical protein HFH87_11540 [Lachnospiraceae bacterium]|nr:hypothetical protein [Lachnospiraceae bacterium]
MKRICVYLTYDKQNIVDRYIGHMLRELKICVDYLAVVCNEEKVIYGLDILKQYADEIFYRNNIGYDVGGWKDALCSFLGWEKVLQYDELVLVNDSMFGPFRSMKSIFAEMDGKSVDFWGLSKHAESETGILGHITEHVQSFFFNIRSRMLHSRDFMEYWMDMPYYGSMLETIKGYEIGFTRFFSDRGYTFAVLARTEENDSSDIKNNFSQYALLSYEMIRKGNFPFLKKQPLGNSTLDCQTQENLKQAIRYIDQETAYDVDLIWENVIRTMNMADLQRNFHLVYIAPSGGTPSACARIAVIVFISCGKSSAYVLEYIRRIMAKYSVWFFATKREDLNVYREQGYECRVYNREEIPEILVDFSGYELVCVLEDTDITPDKRPSCTGKSLFYCIWENLLKDENHISSVIRWFSGEPRLGFLAPPAPDFGSCFGEQEKQWEMKYNRIARIVEEQAPGCPISKLHVPMGISNSFWIRGSILTKLRKIKREDVEYLPFLWSFLAQSRGYYSGIVESEDYASIREVNQQFYLRQIFSQVRRQCGDVKGIAEMREQMTLCALGEYAGKHPHLYVYGAGNLARHYHSVLPGVEAYVVSDGQERAEELLGIPVKYLSEITVERGWGMVICIDEKYRVEVEALLEERGITDYISI